MEERAERLFDFAAGVKGFMPANEGRALYAAARRRGEVSPGGTWLEIGAWCGKSAVYLGAAAEATGSVLYSLDHHHGSEENQAGWEHFDASLVDDDGRLNTLPNWQRTIARAGLESSVVGLIGPSHVVAGHFDQPLDLLFIDGGHGREPAWADFENWSVKIVPGGTLLIHDVFADPRDGGRPPYEIYLEAVDRGFVEVAHEGSLRALTTPTR